MMKAINDVAYWLISSGALSAFFVFVWKYVKPVMIAKQKHAKTLQERELLGLINSLADNAVNSLVSNNEVTGSDKFKQATTMVGGALADKGFDVKRETVEQAVQSAYEKSNLTSNKTISKNEEPQLGLVVDGQPTDPVLKAVETAPNRANDVKEG